MVVLIISEIFVYINNKPFGSNFKLFAIWETDNRQLFPFLRTSVKSAAIIMSVLND